MFQLNEKQLNILKENEFMKSKLRMMENNPSSTSRRLVLPGQLCIYINIDVNTYNSTKLFRTTCDSS